VPIVFFIFAVLVKNPNIIIEEELKCQMDIGEKY
jgi:hypothetical protein